MMWIGCCCSVALLLCFFLVLALVRLPTMAHLLTSYNALSPSSPRSDVTKVLNAIIGGPLLSRPCPWFVADQSDIYLAPILDDSTREELVTALVSDIESCKPGSTDGRLYYAGTSPYTRIYTSLQQSTVSQMSTLLSQL